jgi:hypothetical protein
VPQADIWQPNFATTTKNWVTATPAIPSRQASVQSPTLTHLAAKLSVESSDDGAHTMSQNEPKTSIPEPVKDEKPVDDFFASKLADRIRIDNWRTRLTYIRQEILEIAEQGSQQGFVGLKRETVKLARSIERLEALLGLKTIQ